MTFEEQRYKDTLDAVKRGDDSSKTILAWFKLSGSGGAVVDANGAVASLEERAKERDPQATWMLGVCCEFGLGIEQDIERACMLYGQSSDGGNCIGRILLENGMESERGSGYLRISCL